MTVIFEVAKEDSFYITVVIGKNWINKAMREQKTKAYYAYNNENYVDCDNPLFFVGWHKKIIA